MERLELVEERKLMPHVTHAAKAPPTAALTLAAGHGANMDASYTPSLMGVVYSIWAYDRSSGVTEGMLFRGSACKRQSKTHLLCINS